MAMCRDHRRMMHRSALSKNASTSESNRESVLGTTPDSRNLTERCLERTDVESRQGLDSELNPFFDPGSRHDSRINLEQNLKFKPDFESKSARPPPIRFVRGVKRATRPRAPFTKRTLDMDAETGCKSRSCQSTYVMSLLNECTKQAEYAKQLECDQGGTHRDHPLLPRHRQDGIVAPRSAGSGVDEKVDGFIGDGSRWQLTEHDVQVCPPKDLLQRVEGEPAQFALYEIGAVLHDCLQLQMPVPALPPRDEVEHVRALGALPGLSAGVAGEGHAQCGEDWEICSLVSHSEQSGEEIDLAGDSGDGQEACRPHDQQGKHRLVREGCPANELLGLYRNDNESLNLMDFESGIFNRLMV
jgi:hypothetical protein